MCFVLSLLMPTILSALPEASPAQMPPGITDAPPGGDFTLQSDKGPVSLQDFRGRLVLLYFGYTKCPDICPTSLSVLAQAMNALQEDELEKVRILFISVDPERDTLVSLAGYVSYFHPNAIGMTGSAEQVAQVAALYGAQYYKVELVDSSFGYAVNHSGAIYLLTPDGEIRFIFPHGTPALVILEALRYVMPE